jgi:hypothetical protein
MAMMRYLWIGTVAVGVGAALAGPGIAQADTESGRNGTNQGTNQTAASADSPGKSARPARGVHRSARTSSRSVSAPPAAIPPASAAINPRSTGALIGPSPAAPVAPVTRYRVANPIPPRQQWNANYGYCGETSFISAGLNYGQYMSQYDARALASKNIRQSLPASQLLLGVNDVAAAKAMRLTAVPFNTAQQTTTTQFLTWTKTHVTAGNPVIMGVFTNERRFYGATDPNAGDPEYDHIVTATGISSTRPLTAPAAYYPDDIITFTDNGLWTGTPNGLPQYVFSYALGSFAATRRQANAANGPVYSLSNGKDYGIAITGVADLNKETVRVRLTTSAIGESPAIANGSSTRPASKPVTLTITMSGLTPGKTYNLYRYASMATVPDSNFNANSAKAAQKWRIVATGTTYTMTQTIMSNETAAYRAVPVTAR